MKKEIKNAFKDTDLSHFRNIAFGNRKVLTKEEQALVELVEAGGDVGLTREDLAKRTK